MNNLRPDTAEFSPSHGRHATVGPTGDTQNMHESGRLRLHPPPVTTGPAHAASDAVSARRARATCQSVAQSASDGTASSWAESAAAARIRKRSSPTFCAERRGCRPGRSSNAGFGPRPDTGRAARPQQQTARREAAKSTQRRPSCGRRARPQPVSGRRNARSRTQMGSAALAGRARRFEGAQQAGW